MLVAYIYLRLVLEACGLWLVAWGLQLQVVAACRLRLVASGASGAPRNISDDKMSLVKRICHVGDVMIPALSTAAAFIALVPGWTCAVRPNHGRRVGPALHRSLVYHMRGHTND